MFLNITILHYIEPYFALNLQKCLLADVTRGQNWVQSDTRDVGGVFLHVNST